MTAKGSNDPDGETVFYRWFIYKEAVDIQEILS
ncbi:hypothetical protein [Lunatibacter salilacus]